MSEHPDPGTEVPWAMQVAVRYDKHDLPDEDLVCATVARAVVQLLADPRSRDGEWAADVARWRDGRIRKLVRRARGVRWDRAQALPGVTVEDGTAAARAYVPMPTRPLPPELDALQVSGTTFPATEGDRVVPPARVVVATSPVISMTSGKAAAQCAHGAQRVWESLVDDPGLQPVLDAWREDDYRVEVAHPDAAAWEALVEAPVSIVDAGFTELDGPTETLRAWWR